MSKAEEYNESALETLEEAADRPGSAWEYVADSLEVYRDEQGRPAILITYGGPTTRATATGGGWVSVETWWGNEHAAEEVEARFLAEAMEEAADLVQPWEDWKAQKDADALEQYWAAEEEEGN